MRDGLPLGYPAQGAVTTTKVPAAILCEQPGCGLGVTCVMLHVVETPDRQLHLYLRQFCDAHTEEDATNMRRLYTVKPSATLWRH